MTPDGEREARVRIPVPFTVEEAALIRKAARHEDRPVSRFIRRSALHAAQRLLDAAEIEP